jgi:hypothetical protein
MDRMPSFGFSAATFNRLHDFIRDNEASAHKAQAGIDVMVHGMILVTKGIAQEKSGGPVAPGRRSRPELAGRIPVQRITGAYFAGWKVIRIRSGHWALRNDSYEAYLIEYGIFQKVRRPILKMALIGMLRFMQGSYAAHRFMNWVLAPRRTAGGQFTGKWDIGGGIIGSDREYATFAGGASGGRGAIVPRNVMAGPQGRLPG